MLAVVPHADARQVIVLVHGTFGSRTKWITPRSKMVSAITAQFPDAAILAFKWSGTNGLRHKLNAADILAPELERLMESHRGLPMIIVAHSHGGNVAAWASKRIAAERPEIAAAVYLNTPFIHVLSSSEEETPTLDWLLWLVPAVLIPFIVWPIVFLGELFKLPDVVEFVSVPIVSVLAHEIRRRAAANLYRSGGKRHWR
jgi:pimeloyl-ACP methyl ester carboxylesterase